MGPRCTIRMPLQILRRESPNGRRKSSTIGGACVSLPGGLLLFTDLPLAIFHRRAIQIIEGRYSSRKAREVLFDGRRSVLEQEDVACREPHELEEMKEYLQQFEGIKDGRLADLHHESQRILSLLDSWKNRMTLKELLQKLCVNQVVYPCAKYKAVAHASF